MAYYFAGIQNPIIGARIDKTNVKVFERLTGNNWVVGLSAVTSGFNMWIETDHKRSPFARVNPHYNLENKYGGHSLSFTDVLFWLTVYHIPYSEPIFENLLKLTIRNKYKWSSL